MNEELLMWLAIVVSAFTIGWHMIHDHREEPEEVEPPQPPTLWKDGPIVPVLTWDPADVVKGIPLQVGFNGIRWDGAPFPFATTGDVIITFGEDSLATAKVEIAVRLPEQ